MSDKKRRPRKPANITTCFKGYRAEVSGSAKYACIEDWYSIETLSFSSPREAEQIARWLLRWAAWKREVPE